MEALRNERHETFAQALAQGKTQAEAFRLAYPRSKNWKPDAVWSKASTLAKRPEVQARAEYLRERAKERAAKVRAETEERVVESVLYTLADAMREAEEALRIARERQHAGWIAQAVKLRAQLMGLLVERREIKGDPLDQLNTEQLRQVGEMIRSALGETPLLEPERPRTH